MDLRKLPEQHLGIFVNTLLDSLFPIVVVIYSLGKVFICIIYTHTMHLS